MYVKYATSPTTVKFILKYQCDIMNRKYLKIQNMKPIQFSFSILTFFCLFLLLFPAVHFYSNITMRLVVLNADGHTEKQGETSRNPEEADSKIPPLSDFNPFGTTNINEILTRLTRALLAIIGTVAFVTFIWAGVRMIASRGNEKILSEAKNAMMWAIIGLMLALGSYVLLSKIFEILTK